MNLICDVITHVLGLTWFLKLGTSDPLYNSSVAIRFWRILNIDLLFRKLDIFKIKIQFQFLQQQRRISILQGLNLLKLGALENIEVVYFPGAELFKNFNAVLYLLEGTWYFFNIKN